MAFKQIELKKIKALKSTFCKGFKKTFFFPINSTTFCFQQQFYGKIRVLKDPSIFCEYFKLNYNVEILCMSETFYSSKDS